MSRYVHKTYQVMYIPPISQGLRAKPLEQAEGFVDLEDLKPLEHVDFTEVNRDRDL